MISRRLAATALAAALTTLSLAACTGGGSATPPQQGATTSSAQPAGDPTTEPSEAETTADDAIELPECDGILFETGAEIAGPDLSACMSAAMFAAGTGTQVADSSQGRIEVEFEWTPEFSMHAQGPGTRFVVKGDEGWAQLEGRWVRGDTASSDPEEMLAGNLIELMRAFGDPRGMTSIFTHTAWEVVEHGPVPASDAVADTAWLLEPLGAMEVFGVEVTDAQLWLGADYLGVYFVATGSAMGVTETTSNTFTQWGKPVEIPDPGV